jgi:hypothetical protein
MVKKAKERVERLHKQQGTRSKGDFGVHFNYYDYVDAWSKFFLYQTTLMDHSWFITFDRDHSCGILPIWFA